jgi:hypothetical protein
LNHNGTSAVEDVAVDEDGDDEVVVVAAVDTDDGGDNGDRATSHSKEDSDGYANDLADAEVKVGAVVVYDDDHHHADDGPLPEFHMTAVVELDDLAPRPFLPVEQKFHLQGLWWCCYQDGDIEAPAVLDASSVVGYHCHLMAMAENRQPLPRCTS